MTKQERLLCEHLNIDADVWQSFPEWVQIQFVESSLFKRGFTFSLQNHFTNIGKKYYIVEIRYRDKEKTEFVWAMKDKAIKATVRAASRWMKEMLPKSKIEAQDPGAVPHDQAKEQNTDSQQHVQNQE